ncbi:MAG: hypothetical protein IJU45_06085 [Clostridia bacterium]|nr:hypothetical protein [Clostridia bacterium]
MTFLRSWIQGISIAAITGCAALTLAPDGRSGKGIKAAVSALIIIMFIIPFFKGDITLRDTAEFELYGSEEISGTYLESSSSSLERALNKKCRHILDDSGIYYKEIIINIETDEAQNTVNVKKIVIITDYPDTEKIKTMIENETGIPAVVKTEG